jgi:hypothetical protein
LKKGKEIEKKKEEGARISVQEIVILGAPLYER